MSLTTASASLDRLVSIEELSEALSSVNEDLKEAFSWKDVLVKLVLAAIAIAVVAIVLAVMGLGGFLAAVLIVFVAAIIMTLASFVITGAVNGWGTALGNAAENLIVVAAIGAVLVGATAGVGTFITQSVVPAVTNGVNTTYTGTSIFFTTKAYPAIVQGTRIVTTKMQSFANSASVFMIEKALPTIIENLKFSGNYFFNYQASLEVIKQAYYSAIAGSPYWTIGHLMLGADDLMKSGTAFGSIISAAYYFAKGENEKSFGAFLNFGINSQSTDNIYIDQTMTEASETFKDSLFITEKNDQINELVPVEPEECPTQNLFEERMKPAKE